MKIEIIKCLQDNYAYIVIDETSRLAIVVDPSETKPIIDYIEKNKLNLKFILNTHHHFDHVGGNFELKEKYECKTLGSQGGVFKSTWDWSPYGYFMERYGSK